MGKGIELVSGFFTRILGCMGNFQAIAALALGGEMGGKMIFMGRGFQGCLLPIRMNQPKLEVLDIGIPICYFFHRAVGKFAVVYFHFLFLAYFALGWGVDIQGMGMAPSKRDEQQEGGLVAVLGV